MKKKPSNHEILTLSTYPPRACGIATYSQDLLAALDRQFGHSVRFTVCALEDGPPAHAYSDDAVTCRLDTTDPEAYITLAQHINGNPTIRAVLLQHEFGLFSGTYGDYLFHFMAAVQKPVITTFHSVLPAPDNHRLTVVQEIAQQSVQVIVMTKQSADLLESVYQIPAEQIIIIPHGTHKPPIHDRLTIRKQFGLHDRQVLSTFGLLSPNKSIETAIQAMPTILEQYPAVVYYVLGKTHPGIARQYGEVYREMLQSQVIALGLASHVRFVDDYLSLPELLQYLVATDIYLFTSKDPNQAVSGTFAYAMSAGCPVVSTAIPHAKEWIDTTTGLLIDFEQADQLAAATLRLLDDGAMRASMRKSALAKMRPTYWQNVATVTGQLFMAFTHGTSDHSIVYPPLRLDHLRRMTTATGIIQFSRYSIPDPASGFTLDDNARALIVMLRYFELYRSEEALQLMDIYLGFMARCQQPEGYFLNFMDTNGEPHHKNATVNLEDANGRAVWALGQLFASTAVLPPRHYSMARKMLHECLPNIPMVESPRAIAFYIKGLYYYNLSVKSYAIKHLVAQLADKLLGLYHEISNDNWQWFEKYLTYGNSTLPEAMLYAYLATGKATYKIIARTTFDFLLRQLFKEGRIKVVSNNGWFHYNETPQEYGEQPIDVAYTIEACAVFYAVFGEAAYWQRMETAFAWFLGQNHLNRALYNQATGGCYDGLEEDHVNLNQGAESTICYLLARLTMEKTLQKEQALKASTLDRQPVEPTKTSPSIEIREAVL